MNQTEYIDVGLIDVNEHQPRTDMGDIPALAISIEEVGQLTPVSVVKDGDRYRLVDGHRRFAAITELKRKEIKAEVFEDWDLALASRATIAFELRKAMNDEEMSRGIQTSLLLGSTSASISRSVGVPEDKVLAAEKVLRSRKATEPFPATLERLIAVSELEDDDEAAEQIMDACESEWQAIYKRINHKRKGAASVIEKRAIIEAAGCIVVDVEESVPSGMAYLGASNEKPEGATLGRISYNEYWQIPEASIFWYGIADADEDPEEVERKTREKEDEEMLRLALYSASAKRIEFVGAHLRNEGPVTSSNYLRDFAVSSWESGKGASVGDISDEIGSITGFIPRVYAAILSTINDHAFTVMRALSSKRTDTWYTDRYGSETLHYYAALKGVGYEPTELEASLLATLETVLVDKEDDDA